MGKNRIESKKNNTLNVVHKTKVDRSSNIGVDIDVRRIINKF